MFVSQLSVFATENIDDIYQRYLSR